MSLSRQGDAVIEPREFVEYLKGKSGIDAVDVGEAAIICYSAAVFGCIDRKTGAEKARRWLFADRESRKLHNFRLGGRTVSLAGLEFGAAFSGVMMEVLIACGVRSFFCLGSAGSLQEHVRIGDFVIAGEAIRDEGVSHHYLQRARRVSADGEALSALKRAAEKNGGRYHVGTTWTSDALFRETRREVKRYKARGVLTVDMEAAALYAISQYRGARTCALFYISDSLGTLAWKPGFDRAAAGCVEPACDMVLDAIRFLK